MEKRKTKKGELVEVEFTACMQDGFVFDTTNEEEAKRNNLFVEGKEFKPLKVFIGEGEVIKGFDEALIGKELGKEYIVKIDPEKAYGFRNPSFVKTFPLGAFESEPKRDTFVNVNGIIAKVIAITGGRVVLDFNHPLAGKSLEYKFKILRIIEDDKEKLEVLAKRFGVKFEIKEEDNKIKIKIFGDIPETLEKKAKKLINKEVIFEKANDSNQ
ncbi:MAG: peptidylprolyl isomerase [Candidatus Pacearchaeota archaeon]|nr:peptidylprolyl isomerase [Candidatus Pacearchaeota archaeon]